MKKFEPEPGRTYHFTVTGAARWLSDDPPLDVRCPPECPMCSGRVCMACGWALGGTPPCTHHVIERHGHGTVERPTSVKA